MDTHFTKRGFLPVRDPATRFRLFPQLSVLDELGASLPERLEQDDFRDQIRRTIIPRWPEDELRQSSLDELRLYYVRLGFLASAYINQVSQPRVHLLPSALAVPLCHACRILQRPPILSYDGYALYNWRRLDRRGPIALGNLETIQNFVKLEDEHWFILVHVEIEAIAAEVLAAINRANPALHGHDGDTADKCLSDITDALERQTKVLRRIPERMRPELYHRTFRPYIRFFEQVSYEGVADQPMNFRGETGAQSSIMPALEAFMKLQHRQTILTEHLADLRRFMPTEHQALLGEIEAMPSPRACTSPEKFNAVLEAMAAFREVHYGWADSYVHQRTDDPRGTGGTPYMKWLKQLIDETRAAKLTSSRSWEDVITGGHGLRGASS